MSDSTNLTRRSFLGAAIAGTVALVVAAAGNDGSDVELAATETNVLSTWTDDGYDKISETSMATPVVAGVAGLTLAQHDLSNAALRDYLRATAVDVGLAAYEQGTGRVDDDFRVAVGVLGQRLLVLRLRVRRPESRCPRTLWAVGR